MSERNIDLWRRWIADFNARDIEAIVARCDPGSLRGKRSGAPASQRGAAMLTVRNGKVTRTENYSSREQALEAVGLSE